MTPPEQHHPDVLSRTVERSQQLSPAGRRRVDALLEQIQKELTELGFSDLQAFVHTLETDDALIEQARSVVTGLSRLSSLLETSNTVDPDWARAEILHLVEVKPETILSAPGLMPNGDLIVEVEGKKNLRTVYGGEFYVFPARVDRQSGEITPISCAATIVETLGVTVDGNLVIRTECDSLDLVRLDMETGAMQTLFREGFQPEWSMFDESTQTVTTYSSVSEKIQVIEVLTGKRRTLDVASIVGFQQVVGVTDRGHAIVTTDKQIIYMDVATGQDVFHIDSDTVGRSVVKLGDGGIVLAEYGSRMLYWNPYTDMRTTLAPPRTQDVLAAVSHPRMPDIIAIFDQEPGAVGGIWIVDVKMGYVVHRVELGNNQSVQGILVTDEGEIVIAQNNYVSYIGERI